MASDGGTCDLIAAFTVIEFNLRTAAIKVVDVHDNKYIGGYLT
jgi:hypothetical protein